MQKITRTRSSFEQQERESAKAFAAFKAYLELGPNRTLAETARRIGKSSNLVQKWSVRHNWGARVQDYAVHMAAVEQTAREAVVRQHVADWGKRQEVVREEEWQVHEECIRAGREALEQFTAKGHAARLSEIARILELASKLGRLASGLATDKTEVSGEDAQFMLSIEMALDKVYGPAKTGSVVDVEAIPNGGQKPEIGGQPAAAQPSPAPSGQPLQSHDPQPSCGRALPKPSPQAPLHSPHPLIRPAATFSHPMVEGNPTGEGNLPSDEHGRPTALPPTT